MEGKQTAETMVADSCLVFCDIEPDLELVLSVVTCSQRWEDTILSTFHKKQYYAIEKDLYCANDRNKTQS